MLRFDLAYSTAKSFSVFSPLAPPFESPFPVQKSEEICINFMNNLLYDANISVSESCLSKYISKSSMLKLWDWPPVAPPLSMAFFTFSWSSQRRTENPPMSLVDWAAARCQKQEKWCQCGTFPSNMGDCRTKENTQKTQCMKTGRWKSSENDPAVKQTI